MEKAAKNIRRVISVLLTAAVLAAALPQTGIYAYAAGQEAGKDIRMEEGSAEIVPSQTEEGSKEECTAEETSIQTEEVSGEESTAEETSIQTEEASVEEGTAEEVSTQTEEVSEEEGSAEEAPTQTEDDAGTMESSQGEVLAETEVEDGKNADTQTMSESEEYPVYEDSLKNLTVTPGSYHASIEAEMHVNTNLKFCVIYTTKDASQNDFFPGQDSLVDSNMDSVLQREGYGCEVLDYTPHLSSDGEYYDRWTADFSGKNEFAGYYAPSELKPETTYRYRIAYRFVNSGGFSYTYRFLSVPQEFTTKAAVETSAVSIRDVSVDEVGYEAAKVSWTLDNPDNEYIIETFVTDGEENERIYSEEITPCLDEEGHTIPGKYYTFVRTTGQKQDYYLQLKVYIGTEKEEHTITVPEAISITPYTLSDDTVTVDIVPSTAAVRAALYIDPWYDVDASSSDVFKRGFMYLCVYYREQGTTAPWKSDAQNIGKDSEELLIQELAANTTYEYYVTVAGKFSTLWSRGSKEDPLTFTTTQRVIYQDSDFPDDVLRGYIKEKLGISSGARITSDMLDTLTSLTYSNNYPEANYPDQYRGTGVIRSLEGVQYMKNLTTISFYNHAITDASVISGLTGLKYVELQINDLTELPDLSGLPLLESAKFEGNKITADSIVAEKLPAAFLEKNPDWISAAVKSQSSAAKTPTQEQIIQRYAELPWSIQVANTYAENPSIEAPYAPGLLSDTTLNNAFNMLNFARYVAGVRDDLSLDDYQGEVAQAGALLNAVNQQMSHFPACPDGFPSDLYGLGSLGCFHSNLAVGFSTLPSSILVWLQDSDYSNIAWVGHRRGALDPTMSTTGFGAVSNFSTYSAMHVRNTASADRKNGTISDFVAWPARNTPIQLLSGTNYAWSVSLGSDYYLTDTSAVTVTLKNTDTGKTWTFGKNKNDDGNYFNIDEMEGFGLFQCIVFRPKPGSGISYEAGTHYEVSVTGLTDRTGSAKPLSYTVNFFSLPSNVEPSGISLDKTTLNMQPGGVEALTATVKPDDAKNKQVKWSSSNTAVATVDVTGTVTAVSPGKAEIIAATFNGKQAVCKVAVREYSIDRTELYFDLAEGARTETLTVSDGVAAIKDAKWSSSDESVATVSVDENGGGIVTPTGSGNAFIWARIKDGPRLSCAVTVKNDQLTAISLSAEKCSIEAGSTRLLKVYIVPNDTTLSTDILWSSDHPEVASVEKGLVCALSGGTATITATVGDCTAGCVVTVYEPPAAPPEENVPKNLFALTNVQTKLSDISLQEYEGWKWVYGEAPLARFAGEHKKSFAAVYSRDGCADWQESLEVSLFTVTGIQITADSNTLGKAAEETARIGWCIDGPEDSNPGKLMSQYEEKLSWSSSSPSVVKVTGEGAAARVEAVGTGKAFVKVQITLGSKTFKAQYAVTVVEGEPAGIVMDSADGLEAVPADMQEAQAYRGSTAHADAALYAVVTNASRLTVKSSNPKVVTVGKAVPASDGKYSIPLTVRSAGAAKLTLRLNDAAKTSKEISLYITDPKPNISESTVTINRLKDGGTVFSVYPNEGYQVDRVWLEGEEASRFVLTKEENSADGCSYRITASTDTPKGSYKVEIKATVEGTDYLLPLLVKVVEKKVKYTVKQSAKANLFYKDLGTPMLTVASDEELRDIALEDCDFQVQAADGGYRLVPKTEGALTASCDKKGRLKLTFSGYEPVYTNFTVGVITKAPKLSLDCKSVTLYPNAGITTARLKVLSGKQPFGLGFVQCSSCFKIVGDELVLDGSDLDLSKASSSQEEIKFTSDNWTGSITLPCTVRVDMSTPTLKLQKSSLQLNANASAWAYDMASTEVLWKGAAVFDQEKTPISVSAANQKSQQLINNGIIFESAAGGCVTARLNHKGVPAGTYKFKVNAKIGSDCTVSAPLTVRVVDKELGKAVSFTQKGSIDVLNRDGSFVTVTPSLKALNGSIVSEQVSLSGRSAHLFRVSFKDNKFVIRAKAGVQMVTKYNYGVCLNFTVQNADGEMMQITTPEIRLKLKQGKPQISLTPKGAAFFSGAYNSAPVQISASLKGAADPVIETVELISSTDAFQYEQDRISLLKTGTAVKGKNYSLKFRITLKDQADNEKPVTVKYSARVR